MWPLSRRLRREGFETHNWGYRSTTHSCRYHAEQLVTLVQLKSNSNRFQRIHFVGHSMGCIVIRTALTLFQPPQMGRFVMLAPPNAGSHVATKLGPTLQTLCPTMIELSETENSHVNQLPPPRGYEFGIITAKFDWVISQDKTRLDGASDFSVVAMNHGLLPWHPQAINQAAQFLKSGRFHQH
jgi:pimeloyl-ACP methyl ester carboxylesterase